MTIWYLASPYSHKDPVVVTDRFYKTQQATVWLLGQKIWTYSPIVHCHELAQKFKLPTDAKYWGDYNHSMIEQLSGVIVLLLPNWQESKGVAAEVKHALQLGKPIREVIEQNDAWAFGDGNYLFKALP
jgi:hypothetical protein